MKKLIISIFVVTAVALTGCSSSSYPTAETYPDNRVIFQNGYAPGYYAPGYYGNAYYGGGYNLPRSFYGRPYTRRRPTVIYRTPAQRVIKVNPRVNPRHPQGNWNRNDKNIRSNNGNRNDSRDRRNNDRRN